jgi:transposase InsO family protein
MPWKETTMRMEKRQFIALHETGKFTMAEICRHFEVSRTTGYKILRSYEEHGEKALDGLPRGHRTHPSKTPPKIEKAILKLRESHKTWGARKLRFILAERLGEDAVPSETTVNHILKNHGLVKPRKRRLSRISNIDPYFDPENPNEIWSVDFKGKFRMKNGQYCHPLTMADSKSRYVFAVEALENPTAELSIPVYDRVFREYGLPDMMHSDNGAPFGSVLALRRMTRLSVWLMDLGITPVYSDPGRPTQNGRHERMHRDLKAECTRPAGRDMVEQQRMFDVFRKDYNTLRPHEALGMARPAAAHRKSARNYCGRIEGWDYDHEHDVRMVSANGAIRWNTDGWIMISTALCGKFVGLKQVGDGIWELYYRHVLLGYFNEFTGRTYEVDNFNL